MAIETVSVALLAPLPRPLTYAVPEAMTAMLDVGMRVRVPLGRRFAIGLVLERDVVDDSELATDVNNPGGAKLKAVAEILDREPLIDEPLLAFIRRAATYYLFPLGLALKTALPAGLASLGGAPKIKKVRVYRRSDVDGALRGSTQKKMLQWIEERGPISLESLRQQFPSPYSALQRLEALQLIHCEEQECQRDPFVGIAIKPDSALPLNDEQRDAVKQISAAVDQGAFSPFLLHGVTGSGKTEVYLQAIDHVVRQGQQALILVPEIALTPQLVGRFRARFEQHFQAGGQAGQVGVLHSGMSAAERYDMWRAIVRGEVPIVVGARSAVFAPLSRLGIIVVDEEHDDSYKQSEGFRYQGRDLALMRGQMTRIPVVLGSATPALSSYRRSDQGVVHGLTLTRRIAGRSLPQVSLVDMCQAESRGGVSESLLQAIAETLEHKQQCLLLLNRRGFSPYLLCGDCGATYRCPNCEITLTWHRGVGQLRCHYCDYSQPPADSCPDCGGSAMAPEGMGTERLASELQQLFPEARIERMDRDTTAAKNAQQALMQRMEQRQVDILVGTQMIAKGHDFAAVTLVGILDADSSLNFPDFRAAERSFSLLAQVAGRAGRGEHPGRVMVQTYVPDNPVLRCAVNHDYHQFAADELPLRQALQYPPFGHLVNLLLSGLERGEVEQWAQRLATQLQGADGVEVLGPAPCPLFRLRNRYRMQILLKAENRPHLRALLNHSPQWLAMLPPRVSLAIDVDPVDMM